MWRCSREEGDLTLPIDAKRRLSATAALLSSLLAASGTLCAPESAKAAEEPELEIIGDRPDFTESAVTIPRLHLQGELGVAYSTIGDEEVLSAPNLLLRCGLVDHLEFRLGAPSVETSFTGSATATEPSGAEVGIKAATSLGSGWAVGLLPYAVVPLKKRQWSDTGLESGLKGLWAVDLSDVVSLGGNVGVIFYGIAADRAEVEPEYLASLSLGLSPLDWLGVFVECYGLMNNDGAVAAVADGGFTFLVAPWLQLDAHSGVGLTPRARGFDVGAGAVFLL
jgi:hypothetical protein